MKGHDGEKRQKERKEKGREQAVEMDECSNTQLQLQMCTKGHPEFKINTIYNTHNTVGTFDHNYRCKSRHNNNNIH